MSCSNNVKCDLCGSEERILNLLSPAYQTDSVQSVCNSCLCELHERIDKLVEVQIKMRKSFVSRLFSKMKSRLRGKQCD